MSVSRATRAQCGRRTRLSGDVRRAALLLAVVAVMIFSAACHKKQAARARPPRLPQQGASGQTAGGQHTAAGRTAAGQSAGAGQTGAGQTAAGGQGAAGMVAVAPLPGETETGYASWYGHPYHGRRTSSGEIYDMYQMTAAHRTLPLGTEVEVTNLETGESVRVRINDRGPFVEGRIIDLSLTAARDIHVWGPGTAMVQVKVLSVPNTTMYAAARTQPQVMPKTPAASQPAVVATSAKPPESGASPPSPPSVEEQAAAELAAMRTGTSSIPAANTPPPIPAATGGTFPAAAGRFTVQAGAFSDRRNAERLRGSLASKYPQYVVQTIPAPDGRHFRVWVGNEPSEERATIIARQLGEDGTTAFVLRID